MVFKNRDDDKLNGLESAGNVHWRYPGRLVLPLLVRNVVPQLGDIRVESAGAGKRDDRD
jgi:hypothetical protein